MTGARILRLLYPHTCPFCGQVTERGVCERCRGQVHFLKEPLCKKCGKPIRDAQREYCYDCGHTHHNFDRGYALWLHNGQAQTSVYQFKYHNRRLYSRFYAVCMAGQYGQRLRQWNIQLIIPIPLSKKRRKERGYNQAELVARHLGELTGFPTDTEHLRREKDTDPQKKLSPFQRRENIRRAFSWEGGSLKGKNILLIDDIYTTGNTMDSASKVLKKAGARKVYFLTISIGQGY